MGFLNHYVIAGVMRMSGSAVQLRHLDLQKYPSTCLADETISQTGAALSIGFAVPCSRGSGFVPAFHFLSFRTLSQLVRSRPVLRCMDCAVTARAQDRQVVQVGSVRSAHRQREDVVHVYEGVSIPAIQVIGFEGLSTKR